MRLADAIFVVFLCATIPIFIISAASNFAKGEYFLCWTALTVSLMLLTAMISLIVANPPREKK